MDSVHGSLRKQSEYKGLRDPKGTRKSAGCLLRIQPNPTFLGTPSPVAKIYPKPNKRKNEGPGHGTDDSRHRSFLQEISDMEADENLGLVSDFAALSTSDLGTLHPTPAAGKKLSRYLSVRV